MGRVSARVEVPGQASDAEALWYDHRRWPSFVDGCKYIARVEGDWPHEGALIIWDSFPKGRGRVLEQVVGYEARDVQHLAGLLADEGIADPRRIGVTGISYGGGVSLELAALRDRIARPDGTLAPWTSPGGRPMRIAGAVPQIPWSDLVYAL